MKNHSQYVKAAATSLFLIISSSYFSLKRNKTSSQERISANVIRSVYIEIHKSVYQRDVFPEKFKTANTTHIFEN